MNNSLLLIIEESYLQTFLHSLAFALHLKNISLEMGTNSLGRVYGKYTHLVGDGYGYSKLSINFPEIMAVAALVIYAPGVLGAIETIGAVISIFD